MDSDRDVFNEKPTKEDIVASATETKGAVARYRDQIRFSESAHDVDVTNSLSKEGQSKL